MSRTIYWAIMRFTAPEEYTAHRDHAAPDSPAGD